MVKKLLLLNGLATLGVILFHATGWGFTAMFAWTDRYLPVSAPDYSQLGSLSYYALRIIEQVIQFTIPAFLFVSGYFIAFATRRARRTIEWKVVGNRVRNLIIPYLVWSLGLLAFGFLQGTTHSPGVYARILLTGGANPAYYYVPLLVQFYLLAPLLIPLARKHGLALLVVTGVIQLAGQALQYPHLLGVEIPALAPLVDRIPKWLFLARIFWFTLGVVTGFHLKTVKAILPRFKWPLLAISLLLIPAGIVEWEAILRFSGQNWIGTRETVVDSLYAFAFILALLAFEKIPLPLTRQTGELGARSFGIYLAHSPVQEFFSRIVYHVAPWFLSSQAILQPTLIALGLGIPLLMMEAVRRSPAKDLYLYLFG